MVEARRELARRGMEQKQPDREDADTKQEVVLIQERNSVDSS